MMKIKILGISALMVFLLCAVAFFSVSVGQHGTRSMEELLEDPVVAEMVTYHEAADEVRNNPSSTARIAHYQEWKKRFQKVIADNPDSEFIGDAKSQLLGLYNGLGEYDKSQLLLQELADNAKSPEEKISWQNELGEVSRARYWTSKDTNELKKAQEAFEQADSLYRSLPPEKQEGPLGGQQIVNLCTAAAAAREASNHEKSATLFHSASELFQSSKENAKHAVLSGYDLEAIAEQEMLEWIHVKKESDALKCLEILTKLPTFRWCPSSYALMYAESFYEKNPKILS